MATTTVENQPFSRIVEQRRTNSWSIGVPVAIGLVVVIALIAWFAAKSSQTSQQLANAQREAEQQRAVASQLQQRMAQLDSELARLRDPGRTTVILQAPATGKKGAPATAAWGAATWGELADGKSWVRLYAYGLPPPPQGKVYQLWFESSDGNAILVGKLDVGQDGTAIAEGKELPGVDHGKRVFVSADDEGAKTPGQPLMAAPLPKLKPTAHAEQAPAQGKAEIQIEEQKK